MPKTILYQPVLLRICHGVIALLTVLALVSGFWVYNTYDKRWGAFTLPNIGNIQSIHGTIALTFLLILPFFALYSFHLGYRRLLQEQSFTQLKQLGRPIWWVSVHHFTNTLMLLAVTFAALSGRMMKEEWLPAGEFYHQWYLAHLISWICVFISLALHLLLGAKVGGVPLLVSMFNLRRRSEDIPHSWFRGIKIIHSDLILRIIEVVVNSGIILAFILPAFSS